MNVVLFGATGMVGQGVLRECLIDPDVQRVVVIGRSQLGQRDAKIHEIVRSNFLDYAEIEEQLLELDACFFCLGVSSLGMTEDQYRQITYDFTMTAARVLVRLNPGMTFIYVSGLGTDSSGRGRTMWARVKGQTENALNDLPFRAVYLFRPDLSRHCTESNLRPGSIGSSMRLWRRFFLQYEGCCRTTSQPPSKLAVQ